VDAARLKAIPLFADLDDAELGQIASLVSEVSVSAGKELVREGDYSYEMLAIEEGTAKVERGGEHLADIGPGDVVGEMGVLSKDQRNATVTATTPMRLFTLDRWDAKKLRKMSPELATQLEQLVTSRREHA
jgi:CRP/FNR family cyclic AMP-dependent transcriptional regulator